MLVDEILKSLRGAGIAVPDGCDEATATRLINEALALRNEALAPLIVDTSGRDWSIVDARCARLSEGLERADDLKPGVLDKLEDAVVEAAQDAALGYIIFSSVRRARPHGQALIDFVEVVKQELRGVPLPTATRVK